MSGDISERKRRHFGKNHFWPCDAQIFKVAPALIFLASLGSKSEYTMVNILPDLSILLELQGVQNTVRILTQPLTHPYMHPAGWDFLTVSKSPVGQLASWYQGNHGGKWIATGLFTCSDLRSCQVYGSKSMVGVRPLLVQPYIISTCMVFCGYLDIWTADVNFGKMII